MVSVITKIYRCPVLCFQYCFHLEAVPGQEYFHNPFPLKWQPSKQEPIKQTLEYIFS